MGKHRCNGGLVVFLLGMFISVSAMAEDARVPIIDSSESLLPYAADLAKMGVVAVGRYYGRCRQLNVDLPEKRLIDNPGEVEAILKAGIGILSVYQYYSQKDKFNDRVMPGKPSVYDTRPRSDNPSTLADFNDCVMPDRQNTIEEDAKLDGEAAVGQAKLVGQPTKTAIYFGVDFDLSADRQKNVVKYFEVIKEIFQKNDYILGVYGNGAVSDLLVRKGLVKYVWLNGSPDHEGSLDTYNFGRWNLLQSRIGSNWRLPSALKPINVDTDIENPTSVDVGLWKKKSPLVIPHERNVAVQKALRFVCESNPVVVDDDRHPVKAETCARGVAALTGDSKDNLVAVDCDENGTVEGWMKATDLSTRRVKVHGAGSTLHCTPN